MNRTPLFRRFCYVFAFSTLLALVLWLLQPHRRLDVQLVYSYAIGLSIWFLTDVVRERFFPSDQYKRWRGDWKIGLFLAFAIVAGYIAGTLIGDGYAGQSTFELLTFAPETFIGLVIMSVAISSLFIHFFYQQNRLQVAEKLAIESKLQLLQSQLEPHMLFNTLANLRALIDVDATKAQAMLDRLIDYLRATLGASRVTIHTLELEFARLDDYLALMQIRMGTRLRYSLSLPPELKSAPCPALLLQPLVENAVMHGLEPKAQGGTIEVFAKQVKNQLMLTVQDTGMGMDDSKKSGTDESGAGFGLSQMRERLSTLYGAHADVLISANTPSGLVVTVTMPIASQNS